MAKTAVAPHTTRGPRAARSDDKPAPLVAVAVSAKTRALIEGIRDEFDAYSGGFVQFQHDTNALAPKFMKAFIAWAGETAGTFIAFVRVLDATVPEDRDSYRANGTYQAADYLRRRAAELSREPAEEVAEEDRPVPVYRALAYLVATVMPVVDPTGAIWSAFVREMHWTDEQSSRIKVMAAKLGAVKLPPATKHRLTARTGTEG